MKTTKIAPQSSLAEIHGKPPVLANQNGSVMVLVLMVLAIMTVIGIVSSDSLVTENFIIRNAGIRKQNVALLDSALMRGYQEFMQILDNNPNNFDPALSVWINDINNDPPGVGDPEEFINTIWYENSFTQRSLGVNNSLVDNSLPLMTTRGENATAGLRYGIVGWQPINLGAGGGSTSLAIRPNQPNWRSGRLMAEYVSVDAGGNANGFGMLRQEMGLRRRW